MDEVLITVSLNVELYTLRLPELILISPPFADPAGSPLVKVKLIKVTSEPILKILFPLPSRVIAPDSLALMLIALLIANPLTV